MKDVTVLGLNGTALTSIAAPMDVFFSAGLFWNRLFDQEAEPQFRVRLASPDGKPIRCLNGIVIPAQVGMAEIQETDLIILSAFTRFAGESTGLRETIQWLRVQHEKGTHVGSICTGAFVLAETGLLNGKMATTHWGAVELFLKRYPEVRLMPEKMITDEGDLYCSAGANAGYDLSLYLVEKFCGSETARRCAKTMVLDLGRPSQAPYRIGGFHTRNGDPQIAAAQQWISDHYTQGVRISVLADQVGMSRRTFERRFKSATGQTPLLYLQRTRVEAAKQFLETTTHSFEEITYQVGYGDSSSFRKIFVKETGASPGAYRRRFQRAYS
jgi:transcriptional regulator GlxA family with amidase domain